MNFLKKIFRKKFQQAEENYSVLTCPKCKSDKVTLEFFPIPGEENKENAGMNKSCQICKHEWEIEIVERPSICKFSESN